MKTKTNTGRAVMGMDSPFLVCVHFSFTTPEQISAVSQAMRGRSWEYYRSNKFWGCNVADARHLVKVLEGEGFTVELHGHVPGIPAERVKTFRRRS